MADLLPELRGKAETARRKSSDNGIESLIYCTRRSVEEQARLYRQSRSRKQIDGKAMWSKSHPHWQEYGKIVRALDLEPSRLPQYFVNHYLRKPG